MIAVVVHLVVLFVVGDQVIQRETIVRGDEIDAGVWASPIVLIQIGAPGEPIAHLPKAALVAFPKTANGVAIFPIPFRPKHREIPNLIAALAHVPRFGD